MSDSNTTDLFAEFFVSTEERERLLETFGRGDQQTAAGQTDLDLLCFWAADEEYGIDIRAIQEITKFPEVTPVPRAPSCVRGIVSLRGTIVPVVDLRRLLRLPEIETSRATRVLVLRADNEPAGLVVDRVTSVLRLREEQIESTPRSLQREISNLVRGVGRSDERMIIILDAAALLVALDQAS